MPVTESTDGQPVFDYLTLRLLVGIVAFALPLIVLIFSSFAQLTSISASYHTGARDILVGSLFMIATILVAYRGNGPIESWMANLGAVAAIVAALCPVACEVCQIDTMAILHALAGAILFSVIAYFCFGPFRQGAKKKTSAKAKQRVRIYTVCGWVIIVCILVIGIVQIPAAAELKRVWALAFWAEFFALWAFGFAWIVASKFLPWFADKDERLILSLNLGASNRRKKK
jgi:hypothetical protein